MIFWKFIERRDRKSEIWLFFYKKKKKKSSSLQITEIEKEKKFIVYTEW